MRLARNFPCQSSLPTWFWNEEASIRLINVKASEIVFAYAVSKHNSVHGKQSNAEACAKHLKDVVK